MYREAEPSRELDVPARVCADGSRRRDNQTPSPDSCMCVDLVTEDGHPAAHAVGERATRHLALCRMNMRPFVAHFRDTTCALICA